MWPMPGADNLAIFLKRLSGNLGTSNCWSRKGLSRAVYGFFAYIVTDFIFNIINSRNEVQQQVYIAYNYIYIQTHTHIYIYIYIYIYIVYIYI